jgi:hypothetical protein
MSKPGTDLFSTDRGDEFQIRPHPENKSAPIYKNLPAHEKDACIPG